MILGISSHILDVLAMLHKVVDAHVCSETETEKSTGILSRLFLILQVIMAIEPERENIFKKQISYHLY